MKRREIFDIFSKSFRKRKGSDELGSLNKKSRVVVDFREKSSRLPALLSGAGFEVDFRKLSVGDYVIGDVVIERKEVRDFVGSIINKRIMRQLLDLSQVEKKFLFVEGNLDLSEEKFFGIRSNAIRGFILSVGLKYNIPIVFTKDFRESVKFMLILANKKDKDIDLNFKRRVRTKKERLEVVLEGFDGIGPKSSKKLLKKFGSLSGVFSASEEELRDILGKKAEVFSLLGRKY